MAATRRLFATILGWSCACAATPERATGPTAGSSGGPGTAATGGTDRPGTASTTAGPTTAAADTGNASTSGPKFDVAIDGGLPPVDESTCAAAAAALSSAGCAFAPIVANQNWTRTWGLAVGNPQAVPAQVTWTGLDGALLDEATIAPGTMHVFTLEGNSPQLAVHQSSLDTQVTLQAMRLESDVPVVAYQFTPYADSQVASSDASLLLPEHAWDDDYYVVNYANDGTPWLIVVAMTDGTEVTVTAPATFEGITQPAPGIPPLSAGQSFTTTLDARMVLRLIPSQVAPNVDLTGFRVQSTADVAVFAGTPSMSIPGPGMNFYKDYLEEQLPPVSTWGTEVVGVKFRERGGEVDLYRFVASEDGTVIQLSGDVTDTITLDAGEFAQVATAGSFVATSDTPFLAAHFLTSQDQTTGPKDPVAYPGEGESGNCIPGGGNTTLLGDPTYAVLVPSDQFRTDYVFLAPATYAWDSLTVVAPAAAWDALRLDGAPLPVPGEPVAGGPWARASFPITDGVHTITGTTPVGIEVYGYDCGVAYAYPGGLRLAKINPAG